MSDQADPNQKYEPAPYPRMLYASVDHTIIVHDEAGEAQARAAGYRDFEDIDAGPTDGLDVLSVEALIAVALGLLRTNLAKTPKPDLIEGIRAMRAKVAEEAAAVAAQAVEPDGAADPDTSIQPDEFDAKTDDELRAHLTLRDGKTPHHKLGREKLLQRAREGVAPTSEADPG